MSDIIPNYSWNEVKNLSFEELLKLPSCEITDDGEGAVMGLFLVIPSTEYIKAICDTRSQLSNSTLAQPFKKPSDYLKEPEVVDKITESWRPATVVLSETPIKTTQDKTGKKKPKSKKKR